MTIGCSRTKTEQTKPQPVLSTPETGVVPETPEVSSNETLPYFPEVQRISVQELKKQIEAGADIIVVDSRTRESFDLSHIAGAVSMPYSDMVEPYTSLTNYGEVIFYCT